MGNGKDLHILWTNGDPVTAQYMVMMYAVNSMNQHWWDSVTVIIWGATAKLAAEDRVIQEHIAMAKQAGVAFTACRACARQLGVIEKLETQGIEIKNWGLPLTELIQNGSHLITV